MNANRLGSLLAGAVATFGVIWREVQCRLDIIESRREYGRELRIWSGVDKHAIAAGPQAIDRELERVRPLIEDGGYIPGPDHGLPPDVSFANYCYYMEKLREIL